MTLEGRTYARGAVRGYAMGIGMFVPIIVIFLVFGVWRMQDKQMTITEERQLNYLNSSIFDLENPTNDNYTIRKIECENMFSKSAEYRKIPVKDINKKVERYVAGCLRLK